MGDQAVPAGRNGARTEAREMFRLQAPLPDRYTQASNDELVAMIGAIVLTLRHRKGVLRQNVLDQVARTRATGMRIVQIKSGEGLSE